MDTEAKTTMNNAQRPRVLLFMAMWIIGTLMLLACGIEIPILAQLSQAVRINQPPNAIPATPTQLSGHLTALDGLYVGRYPGGDTAMAYLFKPSGTVAYDFYQSVIDPDAAASWPTIEVYVETEAKDKGYEPYRVNLGTYQLLGDRIRLNTQELYIDSIHRLSSEKRFPGIPLTRRAKK
jgi:hypothetical protein